MQNTRRYTWVILSHEKYQLNRTFTFTQTICRKANQVSTKKITNVGEYLVVLLQLGWMPDLPQFSHGRIYIYSYTNHKRIYHHKIGITSADASNGTNSLSPVWILPILLSIRRLCAIFANNSTNSQQISSKSISSWIQKIYLSSLTASRFLDLLCEKIAHTVHDTGPSSAVRRSVPCFDALTLVHYGATGLTYIMYCEVIMDKS